MLERDWPSLLTNELAVDGREMLSFGPPPAFDLASSLPPKKHTSSTGISSCRDRWPSYIPQEGSQPVACPPATVQPVFPAWYALSLLIGSCEPQSFEGKVTISFDLGRGRVIWRPLSTWSLFDGQQAGRTYL